MRTGVAIGQMELGVLSITDVLAAVEGEPVPETIEALVIPPTGLPFAGVVALTKKASGFGMHHALQCPRCGRPSRKLYVHDGGRIGCGPCARKLARRHAECTHASWSLGGREEDRLLRLVAGRGRPTAAAIERGLRLAQELIRISLHPDVNRRDVVI